MRNLIVIIDKHAKHIVTEFLKECPNDWFDVIKETCKDLTDPKHPAMYLCDGSPFLNMGYIDLPPELEDDEYDDPDNLPNREYSFEYDERDYD